MKILVLLLFLCACPCVVRAQTAPVIARAQTLREAEKFAQAQQILEAQLATTQVKAERDELQNALSDVHYAWAEQLEGRYDFQGAIVHYFSAYETDKSLRRRKASIDLNRIGAAYRSLSRYEEALRTFEQALLIVREIKERQGEAVTLVNIGAAYNKLSRSEEALRTYEQALPVLRELKNRQGEAATLNNIGRVYHNLSRSEDALAYYEQALPIFREVKDLKNEAITLGNIGSVFGSLSRFEESLRTFEQALLIVREVKERQLEATMLNNSGLAYGKLSRYEEALRAFEQSLPIYREVQDRDGEASALGNIGAAYQTLNRTEDALAYYEQALPIRREVKDRQGEATTLNNIGAAYREMGQYPKSLSYYEQALLIQREVKDWTGEADTLNNIGATLDSLHRYDHALVYYEQALLISRQLKDRSGEAVTRNNIGFAYRNLSRYEEALRTFEQALLIHREVKNRQGEADTLGNIMSVNRAQKQPELAILFGKQAVNVTQSIRRDMRGLDQTSRAAYVKGKENTYQTLARLLIGEGRFAEAEEVLAMLQQDEFLDFVRRDARGIKMETLDSDFVGAEQTVVAEQNAKIQSVALLSEEDYQLSDVDKPSAEQSARLKQVQAQLGIERDKLDAFWQALPARLKRNAADVNAERDQLSTIVPLLREMGEKSGSRVALISAFVDDKGLELLLTLPSGQTVNLSYTADEKAGDGLEFSQWLNAKIFAFKESIKRREPVENAATALWNIVGCRGELGAQLEGAQIQTVMWRLAGPLRAIPLAALRDKDGYLVEKYRNVVLTAGSTPNLAHDPVDNWRALGLGVTKARTVETESFPALSGVEGELRAVVDDPDDGVTGGVMPGKILRDADFNKASFFRALRGATAQSNAPWQVVHIASHFKLASDDLKSFLLTGDGTLSLAELKARGATRPLFPGVELMTLSACDTLGGTDNLGALAELNGARSVLATLWPVADKETAQIMADFYANHAATPRAGKAVALQNAQLKLLHAGGVAAHPYYWAPFVLMGNWR